MGRYKPWKKSKYYELKENLLTNADNFFKGSEMGLKAFKDKLFPLSNPSYYPNYREDEESSESKEERKFDTATGGEDIPKLETKEDAEKRQTRVTKS